MDEFAELIAKNVTKTTALKIFEMLLEEQFGIEDREDLVNLMNDH